MVTGESGGGTYHADMTPEHAKRSSGHDAVPFGLVPPHTDYGATVQFIYNTISALNRLSDEAPVRQYVKAEPDAHRAILELSRAVAQAGIRVRDSGQMRNILDEHLKYFSADEIWMFDLAIDVVAMLGTVGGLSSGTRMSVLDKLKLIDEDKAVHSLHWKREVHKAGQGPAEFRGLRAHVPQHKPRG